MTDISRLIKQLLGPSLEARIEAARALAWSGRRSRRAHLAVWSRFVGAEDREEAQTMRDALTLIAPDLIPQGESRRRSIRDRQSYQEVVRGYDAEQARKKVAELLESLQQELPLDSDAADPLEDATAVNLPVHVEAAGLEAPAVLPVLLDALARTPVLREMLSWILGRVGRGRPEVGELAVPLLGHAKPSVVDAAADVIGDVGDVGGRIDDAVLGLVKRYLGQPAGEGAVSGYALQSLAAGGYAQEVTEGVQTAIEVEREESRRAKLNDLLREMARPALARKTRWVCEVDLAIQEELLAKIHIAHLAAKQLYLASRQARQGQRGASQSAEQVVYAATRNIVLCVKAKRRTAIVTLRWLTAR